MKLARSMVLAVAVSGVLVSFGARAAEPVKKERVMECAQAAEKYQATAEAKQRFAQLQGSCEGIYKINDGLYAHVTGDVKKVKDGVVTMYLPATDKTIEVTPRPDARVNMQGKMLKPSQLRKGDKIDLYLSLDKFAEGKVQEVELTSEKQELAPAPVVEPAPAPAAELPKTASDVPALALLSSMLLGVGFIARRFRRSA